MRATFLVLRQQKKGNKLIRSFTLVELLIVIAILAVLAAAVVMVLNPGEFLSQGRDAKRVSDLRNIVSSLGIYINDYPQASIGESQTVYISIPDTSSTCTSHILPSLPAGWSYRCATGENYMKTDGTGWIPIDFNSIKGGSPLPYIPVDQNNTAVSGKYYIYVPDGWAFASTLGSSKYLKEIASKDGGFDPIRFEIGKDLSIIGVINRIVGIWDFDNGSGGTVSEAGISGNDGVIFGNPQWTEGISGSALLFDGEGDYVRVVNQTGDTFSVSFWMKSSGPGPSGASCADGDGLITSDVVGVGNDFSITLVNGHVCFFTGNTEDSAEGSIIVTDGEWHNVTVSRERGEYKKIFVDGVLDRTAEANQSVLNGNLNIEFGGSTVTGNYFSGIIDKVLIYNRILSEGEVSALYNIGS